MPRAEIATQSGVLRPEPAQGQDEDARGRTPDLETFAGMHPVRSVISRNSPVAASCDADVPGRRSFGSRPVPGSCARGGSGEANEDTGSGHGTHGLGMCFWTANPKTGSELQAVKKTGS
jgi:hypothetical protein